VIWRFLRNRRLILRLHRPTVFRALIYWAHCAVILSSDSVISLLHFVAVHISVFHFIFHILKKSYDIVQSELILTDRTIVSLYCLQFSSCTMIGCRPKWHDRHMPTAHLCNLLCESATKVVPATQRKIHISPTHR